MSSFPRTDSSGRARTLLLGFAVIAPVLALLLISTSIWLALLSLFVSHMLILYATLVPGCQWWGPVCTRFTTAEREVWLTIDDGPSLAHTLKMLDLLKHFDAKATFFVIGENAEKYPHLITEILTQGHTLANHTYSHRSFSFWCAGPGRTRREIDACAATLRTLPERPAIYFRAPAGLKNMFVHPALARRRLALVGWTVRGLDTVKRDAAAVAERVEKGVSPGAIILLHEGHRAESMPDFHPRCLELVLQRLSARGFRFVIPRREQFL